MLLAALFLVVGLATLGDYGTTWDEHESYEAGVANLQLVAHPSQALAGELEWPWHELTGYQFVFDTARAALAVPVNRWVGRPDASPAPGFRLANLLLATGALLLVFGLALGASGEPLVAAAGAAVLATLPKFLGHSQNNPKDLIALLVFTLAVAAAERLTRTGRWRDALLLGAAIGLAVASSVMAVLAAPVAALWVLGAGTGRPIERLTRLGGAGLVSLGAFFLAWPWLWPAPLERLEAIVSRVRDFPVNVDVLYLGQLYPWADPPWHYFLVSLLVSTPLVYLAAAAIGAVEAGRRRQGPDPPESLGPGQDEAAGRAALFAAGLALPVGRRRLARLALLWLAVPLLAEPFTGSRYDGVRHFLAVLVPLALLAGLGLARALHAVRRLAGRRRAGRPLAALGAVLLVAVAVASVPIGLARFHPYQDAYLNAAAAALVPPPRAEYLELEYWGGTLAEGARWLNEHAEPNAVVLVPTCLRCAEQHLAPHLERWEGERIGDPARAHYLMILARPGFWSERVRRLRAEAEPVFVVERGGAVLLEVYREGG